MSENDYYTEYTEPAQDETVEAVEETSSETPKTEISKPSKKRNRSAPATTVNAKVALHIIEVYQDVEASDNDVRTILCHTLGLDKKANSETITSVIVSQKNKNLALRAIFDIGYLSDIETVYELMGKTDADRRAMWALLRSFGLVDGALPAHLPKAVEALSEGISKIDSSTSNNLGIAAGILGI